ncbi:hypothetical protein ACS0TY_017193 [Phlomoides rotata]
MTFESSFGDSTMHNMGSDANIASKQKLPENSNGSFDCNICLDPSQEPVVTLCGHLYCWPCIYKWLQVQSSSFESNEQPKCPVCKAYISTSSLVPLYGGGKSISESETRKPQLDLIVPPRPPALAMNALLASSNQQNNPIPFQPNQQQYFSHPLSHYTSTALGSPTSTSSLSPTINMVSEIVFAGMFGSSETNVFAHPYSNSYSLMRNGSPRLRRQEIQLDKSLNRLSMFLFCCIALCLIFF